VLVWSAGADELRWTVHSAPHWPPEPAPDADTVGCPLPHAELRYGQSFAQLVLPLAALPDALAQLHEMQAIVCHHGRREPAHGEPAHALRFDAPPAAGSDGLVPPPALRRERAAHDVRVVALAPGVLHIAKPAPPRLDLYLDVLAPRYGQGRPIAVESWRDAPAAAEEEAAAASAALRLVLRVRWPDACGGRSYREGQDHSKWCVGPGWVVVADLNRARSQRARGGGGVMLQDARLARAMDALVAGCCA
jgi:hypothetical protein